jgi:hypothetical protein
VNAVALASFKHSPGVTTAALALGVAAGEDAVVIEADPSGGDIAARAGLTVEPGIITLAAAARHAGTRLDLDAHVQHVPAGAAVLVSPSAPDLARAALGTIGPRLTAAVDGRLGFFDLGRIDDLASATERAPGADLVLLLAEPTVAGVEHLRARLADAPEPRAPRIAALLIGDRPYRPAEVEATLGMPVVGALAVDPRGVAALYGDRAARRTLVARSARSLLGAIRSLSERLTVTA